MNNNPNPKCKCKSRKLLDQWRSNTDRSDTFVKKIIQRCQIHYHADKGHLVVPSRVASDAAVGLKTYMYAEEINDTFYAAYVPIRTYMQTKVDTDFVTKIQNESASFLRGNMMKGVASYAVASAILNKCQLKKTDVFVERTVNTKSKKHTKMCDPKASAMKDRRRTATTRRTERRLKSARRQCAHAHEEGGGLNTARIERTLQHKQFDESI